jgi:type I restriction enzyme, S subunit
MDVRIAYKRSEIGIIPESWSPSTIGDVTTKVGSGITPTGGSNCYKEYGRAFVRSQNVGWGSLRLDDLVFIDDATHKSFDGTELANRDVLLNITGASIGRSAVADRRVVGGNVNQHVCIVRCNTSKAIPEYLNFVLLSSLGQRQIDSFQAGGNREGLNFAQVRSIMLPLPDVEEQEAIAEALSDADALIESLEQLLVKKRHIKQGAMQELLTGKKRLPGFSGKWKRVRAGDIGRFQGGTGFPTVCQGVESGEYPFFKVSDMNNDGNETYMEVANNYIDESTRRQIGAVVFPRSSIVFAKVGAAVFLERKKILVRPSCLDNNMAAFLPDSDIIDSRFMHLTLLNTKLGELVSTTALPSLSGSVLSGIQIAHPTLAEQTAIATILSDMDSDITALEEKLVKARNIKQGMMQELLTGRIRLVKPASAA